MNSTTTAAAPAQLLRRLAACFYDSLLLAALWMVAAALWLPFTGGEAVPARLYPLFQLYLAIVAVTFFVGFWCRAGRTLGMQAWHLRVQQPDGNLITYKQGLIRCAVALVSWAAFGLGFL